MANAQCFVLSILFIFLSVFNVKASNVNPSNIESSVSKTTSTTSLDDIDVDAVFLYIDVNDPDLKKRRPELKNCIKKDVENDELKYALRSVLKNIPWIRKIFIFMPNKKVKFLKDQNEISDKIVYVNQEELVGDTRATDILMLNL